MDVIVIAATAVLGGLASAAAWVRMHRDHPHPATVLARVRGRRRC